VLNFTSDTQETDKSLSPLNKKCREHRFGAKQLSYRQLRQMRLPIFFFLLGRPRSRRVYLSEIRLLP
jgi:hypothetical protein